MIKPLSWYFRRHSLLYKIRFKLVSKDTTYEQIKDFCYNSQNHEKDIPPLYFQINNMIFPNQEKIYNDFEKAKKISKWLTDNIKGGPGLGISSENALKKMIRGEGGVCSDFAQVFNNFCVINNIKVREWGLKNIIGQGHSHNEIYSNEFRKWILIDVSKSIYFYHKSPKLPLSVGELFDLKKQNKTINYTVFNKKINPDTKKIEEYYLLSNPSPFLITNYCNKTYDFFLYKLNFLPVSIIHGLVFLIGKSYSFEFPKNKE